MPTSRLLRPIAPMLATPGELPGGKAAKAFAFEYKWDGIRALLHWDARTLRVFSRNANDVTAAFPELRGLADQLGRRKAILDGEVVALNEQGRPEFGLLQQRLGRVGEANVARAMAQVPASYVVFDLLHLGGEDLTGLPYEERRERLLALGLKGPAWAVPPSDPDGQALLAASRQLGLEGVVAKRLDSPYRPGQRTPDWVKVRNRMRQEFVVGGWSAGQGSRGGTVGSLLVGYHDSQEPGRLVYAGRVGSGLGGRTLLRLHARLKELEDECPFDESATQELGQPDVRWVRPEIVCEVEFSEVTRDGHLRQPAFKGLRTDKDASEVVWEQAGPPPPRVQADAKRPSRWRK